MRREILRKLGKVFGVAALCGVLTIAACACGSQASTEVTEEDVLTEAKDWVETNYGQVYEVKNIECELTDTETNDGETQYTIAMSCETKSKYETIDETPFVSGLLAAAEEKGLTDEQQADVDKYIEGLAADSDFGEYEGLTLILVVEVDNEDASAAHEMYYLDADNEMQPIEDLEIDVDTLYADGQAALTEIIK